MNFARSLFRVSVKLIAEIISFQNNHSGHRSFDERGAIGLVAMQHPKPIPSFCGHSAVDEILDHGRAIVAMQATIHVKVLARNKPGFRIASSSRRTQAPVTMEPSVGLVQLVNYHAGIQINLR